MTMRLLFWVLMLLWLLFGLYWYWPAGPHAVAPLGGSLLLFVLLALLGWKTFGRPIEG